MKKSSKLSEEIFEAAVQAIINGNLSELESLLTRYPALATARFMESKGQPTLLHFVAANGVDDRYQKTPDNILQVAQLLFDYGANPRETAAFYGGGAGSTALVGLVSSVHPYLAGKQEELVEIFIEGGAPLDGIHGDGMPLATALAFWYPGAAKKLIALGAGLENLVFAAAGGKVELIESWVEDKNHLGPKIYPDPFGREVSVEIVRNTALVKACLCSQVEMVAYLIKSEFDINGKTINGQTGLHEAAYRGSIEMVEYLVTEGSKHVRDDQFNSLPIHWAHAGNQEKTFNYLLDKSPMELADYAEFGLLDELKKILKDYPEKINEQNGWPLREAVSAGQIGTVEYLMNHGADPTRKNEGGKNALEIAREKGHEEIWNILNAL